MIISLRLAFNGEIYYNPIKTCTNTIYWEWFISMSFYVYLLLAGIRNSKYYYSQLEAFNFLDYPTSMEAETAATKRSKIIPWTVAIKDDRELWDIWQSSSWLY